MEVYQARMATQQGLSRFKQYNMMFSESLMIVVRRVPEETQIRVEASREVPVQEEVLKAVRAQEEVHQGRA